MYSLCQKSSESISHLFLDCEFTKLVWHRLTLTLKLQTTWAGSTLHACLENWSIEEFTLSQLPTLWSAGIYGWFATE
jgi:hypothetical protein